MAIETGLWFVMVAFACLFTFFSLKTLDKTMMAFSMLAAALWIMLAVIHAGGLEVSTTTTLQTAIEVNGTLTPLMTNSTSTFLQGGNSSSLLSWLFLGFAFFAIFNAVKLQVKL